MFLADFASSYVSKKENYVAAETDNIKRYTAPICNINGVEPNPDITVLKNEFGELQKRSQIVLFVFTKFLN